MLDNPFIVAALLCVAASALRICPSNAASSESLRGTAIKEEPPIKLPASYEVRFFSDTVDFSRVPRSSVFAGASLHRTLVSFVSSPTLHYRPENPERASNKTFIGAQTSQVSC
jgi:hypothetical protein